MQDAAIKYPCGAQPARPVLALARLRAEHAPYAPALDGEAQRLRDLRGQFVKRTNSSTVLQAIVSLETPFLEDLISTLRA